MSSNKSLKLKAIGIIKTCGVPEVKVKIQHLTIVEDFKAGVIIEDRTIILSPKLASESTQFLVNVITHELGHILADHGNKPKPKTFEEAVKFEEEANHYALPLYSKFYPVETFYFNHKDEDRMKRSAQYYKAA